MAGPWRASASLRRLAWERRGLAGWVAFSACVPAALLFRLAVGGRSAAFTLGLRRPLRPGARVISVGNLSVGGTGKTPLVLWLAERLAERGRRVAVLTRGYGRAERGVCVADGSRPSDVDAVGDEGALLARRVGALVIAARRRTAAARMAVERFGCDTLVLDDGFQHRQVARDVDLVLTTGRDMANGWCLPAGPLREPPRSLRRADALVLVSRPGDEAARPPAAFLPGCTFNVRVCPGCLVVPEGGKWREESLGTLASQRIVAVSGIADASPFYFCLRELGAELVAGLDYPDHHRYEDCDWRRISRAARSAERVITTEKDLVKLERYPFPRGMLAAVRLHVSVDDAPGLIALVEGSSRAAAACVDNVPGGR